MQTISTEINIRIPATVAVCPICGGEVVVDIDEWEQNDDETWQAGECGTHCNCITEPDIGSDEWEDWFSTHWETPYTDWLPVDEEVRAWINQNYRFIV